MSKVIPKEQLTAYQRWELAAFEESDAWSTPHARHPATAESEPAAEPPPEPEEKVVLPTAEDIEQLHQEAWQEGYQLGLEEGRKAGFATGQEESERHIDEIKTLVSALEGGLVRQDQEVAREVLELALVMARQILRSALEIKPELILDAISEALKTLPSLNGHHKIITHPDSAQIVRDWLAHEHGHLSWKVTEDAKIEPGSFRFESAYNELDGSIEARWLELTRCLGSETSWLT
jgi:flagellar assembly protein FliH